jgi:hypothetical protein
MLTSTKVFQSAFVPAGRSMNALPSQIPVRSLPVKNKALTVEEANNCFTQKPSSKKL